MQRISLSWFSQLGIALKPLGTMSGVEKFDFDRLMELYTAKGSLDALADSRVSHLQLRASRMSLRQLIEQVDAVIAGQNRQEEFARRKFQISRATGENAELGSIYKNSSQVWGQRKNLECA